MRAGLISAALAVALSLPAQAKEAPLPGKADSRVRTVIYDPANVVTIDAAGLRSTMIAFAADETIGPVSIGDPKAWIVKPAGHFLFIKPGVKDTSRRTNMQVITIRKDGSFRVYQFDLLPHLPTDQGDFIYSVVFKYPADAAKAAAAKASAAQAVQAEHQAKARLDTDWFYGKRNWDYDGRGSRAIEPTAVSDNGEMTTFRFYGRAKVPAIYEVLPDGKEQLATVTMKNGAVMVHGIAQEWRLRSGKEVYEVFNANYDPAGYDPRTGTTSPEVIRTTKGID